jgi:3-oxoacyl-[acyl-carrier protein] reductase
LLEEAKLQRMPKPKSLAGRVALVTGGAGGIGQAIAARLMGEGACVVLADIDAQSLDAAVADFGKQFGKDVVSGVHVDVTNESKVESAFHETVLAFGGLDILVANAGIAKMASIEETTLEDFDALFAVNVRAPFFLVQQLLPILREGSSVIFLSSLAAHAAVGTLSAYAATKGAVDTLVKHFAAVLGPRGIRVNAVAPGVVATDMSSFAKTDEGREATTLMQALKRVAQPDDIAGAIAFLASDAARWISGDILRVDGGSKL